jgi:hypothetical protein
MFFCIYFQFSGFFKIQLKLKLKLGISNVNEYKLKNQRMLFV